MSKSKHRVYQFLLLSILILTTCSCSRSTRLFNDIIPPSRNIDLSYSKNPSEEIKILYVTCGMLVIEHGNESIVIDPFFSYQKMTSMIFGIRSRERFFRSFKQLADSTIYKKSVHTGFVSHTHYDHAMDLPLLIDETYFPELRNVYGSVNLPAMMFHHRDKGVNITAMTDDQIFNPLKPGDPYKWISAGDSVSVLPIASMHAPHKFGILLMNGKLKGKYFQKKRFKNPYTKSRAFKWATGCSYSFLIKFLKRDGSEFRVFVQTSASNDPYGLPPEGEKADLAVLCFASMQEVDDHPNYIMKKTQAKKLMLVHWEDFFRYPKSRDDIQMVRGTNKKLAKRRLDEVRNSTLQPEVIMPKPGSLIRVSY
jgi:hypothetical protein